MEEDINITEMGLTPAEALVRLYGPARQLGLGMLHEKEPLTVEQAEGFLAKSRGYVDYLNGCPIKVNFREDGRFSPFGYDRDQGGPGAALRALQAP